VDWFCQDNVLAAYGFLKVHEMSLRAALWRSSLLLKGKTGLLEIASAAKTPLRNDIIILSSGFEKAISAAPAGDFLMI
jgi:hypothetical protein